MEEQNNIHKLLSEKLSADHSDSLTPSLKNYSLIQKTIQKRLPRNTEHDDMIALLAGFLNMKIKLYHAVIAVSVIAAVVFFYTKEEPTNRNEASSRSYDSNIAAVSNNTLLSSINTIAIRK